MKRTIESGKTIPIHRSGRNVYWKLAVAASVAALLVFSVSMLGTEEIFNANNSVQAHVLPDGSTVYLNSGAELSYNEITWPIFRDLEFAGSGFFDVKKGKKFSVNTDQGVVSVLGTSFSVLSANNKLKVSCKTGKVLVECQNSTSTLTPGKGVRVGSDYSDEFSLNAEYIDAWVEGTYHFDNVSIEDVFNSIEDFSNFDIEYPEGLTSSYSGEFSTAQPVEEIMEIVCQPVGLTYEIIEDKNLILIK